MDQHILNKSRVLFDGLASLGYGEADAQALAVAHASLLLATSEMIQCREGPPEGEADACVGIGAFGSATPQNILLLHSDILLPSWEKFAEALASVAYKDQGYIHLSFRQVKLESVVTKMLAQPLKAAPLQSLRLQRNRLGSDGMKFIMDVLKMNDTIEFLDIKDNRIKEGDAISLVTTVNEHPTIHSLYLHNCGIGLNKAAMAAVVPALSKMTNVSLRGNRIGFHGATLISNYLASNPEIKRLDLSGNVLQDRGAIAISQSLKTNTKLRVLNVQENHITPAGVNAFHSVLTNWSVGINAVYKTNHTCFVDVGGDSLLAVNSYLDPKTNRKLKILNALYPYDVGGTNLACLNLVDLPLGIMPKVLCLIQGQGVMAPTYNALKAVFAVMREWSLPLLYTSCMGPEVRRSERIRKRNIMKLGEVNLPKIETTDV